VPHYCKQAQLGKESDATTPVYLTMQPLTACELDAFLKCACEIIANDQLGSLQRLAEAFVRQPMSAALLHFAYQQARAQSSDDRRAFFQQIMSLQASDGQGTRAPLFPIRSLRRITVDHDTATQRYFAPMLYQLHSQSS